MSVPYSNTQTPVNFPRQKVSYEKKNKNKKEWYKQCIEAAENMALFDDVLNHRKLQVLYDLDNDIIDEEEMEKVFNPMGLDSATFPSATKNYPLSVPKLDLLQGEELKRRFNFNVRAKNLGVESAEQTAISDMMFSMLIEELQSTSFSEEDFEKRLNKFSRYVKYNWKSKHELTATRILQYLWREQDLQEKFNTSFRDELVGGVEIFRVDIDGEEPVAERCHPKTVFPIRIGNSHRIEDSDIIVEITYEPINTIIDQFYEHLSDDDIDQLEDLYSKSKGGDGNSPLKYDNEYPAIYSNLDFGNGPGFMDITQFNGQDTHMNLPFDTEGNVRVCRARWIGRKRVGILKYINPSTGEEEERVVSELYEPNKDLGESIKYIWINEAYEGTKIAKDIFAKMQPREVQMRHFDNKSKCFLGYVGTYYGKSLMERMESYQYLYNVYMKRLEMIMAKYKGPIYELDISKVPDEWELDKWMYYADILGWAVIDNFNESKKGASTGKIAGAYQSGRVLDPNIGNYIQQIVLMLQHIEDIMGKISGVNDQRLGQIDNRETVGGVERAVTQSSHITERLFFMHDETKKRVMLALLDTAKYTWRKEKSKKLNFVLDDMSRVFLEFMPEDIASTEFDLFVTNSSRDMEIRQGMKQLAHAAVQNGARTSVYADILTTESISDMISKLDAADEEVHQKQMELQQMNNQAQQQIAQLEAQEKQADRDVKYAEIDKDILIKEMEIEADRSIKAMEADVDEEFDDDSIDKDKIELEKKKHNDKIALDKKKLQETIRSNKAKEQISKNKPKTSK